MSVVRNGVEAAEDWSSSEGVHSVSMQLHPQVMPLGLGLYGPDNNTGNIIPSPERLPHIKAAFRKQARQQHSVRGKPEAVAAPAKRLGPWHDEAYRTAPIHVAEAPRRPASVLLHGLHVVPGTEPVDMGP